MDSALRIARSALTGRELTAEPHRRSHLVSSSMHHPSFLIAAPPAPLQHSLSRASLSTCSTPLTGVRRLRVLSLREVGGAQATTHFELALRRCGKSSGHGMTRLPMPTASSKLTVTASKLDTRCLPSRTPTSPRLTTPYLLLPGSIVLNVSCSDWWRCAAPCDEMTSAAERCSEWTPLHVSAPVCTTASMFTLALSTINWQVQAAIKKAAAKFAPLYSATSLIGRHPRIEFGAGGPNRYQHSVPCGFTAAIRLLASSTVSCSFKAETKKETSKTVPSNWVALAIGVNPRVSLRASR